MSELTKRKMPKGYAILWLFITAIYGVWMTFFMKDIVLNKYATEAARTVDGALHSDITGIHTLDAYVFWVIISCLTLLLYVVFISKILYADEINGTIKKFCGFMLIFGIIYMTVYSLLSYEGMIDGEIKVASFSDKIKVVTASMIGLEWPWMFRGWGIFSTASVFVNTVLAYRKFNYDNKLGIVAGSLGSAAIYMTINLPSYGENKDFSVPRCSVHWAGALLFAVLCATPLVLMLLSKARKEKGRFLVATIVFCAVLALMLVLLVTVGKSAMIENIPMYAAYILLALFNFTGIFEDKKNA